VPRESIPTELAAEVLFSSDRTCCVCRIPGKRVQIHHVDEDPSNNVFENLAALCFDCHDLTQQRGGFGRHLKAVEVRRHRDDWIARVNKRRDEADRLRAEAMAGLPVDVSASDSLSVSVSESVGIAEGTSTAVAIGEAVVALEGHAPTVRVEPGPTLFIKSLAKFRREAHLGARAGWQSGVTADRLNATYAVVDAMQGVLANLASFMPKARLEGQAARDYFSELVASRFRWRRLTQPLDGTMAEEATAAEVLSDVESMIVQMVRSLCEREAAVVDFEKWRSDWSDAVD
jgi:hypothetical protein